MEVEIADRTDVGNGLCADAVGGSAHAGAFGARRVSMRTKLGTGRVLVDDEWLPLAG